ncbi:MAG: tetratricopeptide repeat protein [Carboxylicivirga sp.]|nr:tetratricopeptide repeat protein [Carboxylicivirga sp.]
MNRYCILMVLVCITSLTVAQKSKVYRAENFLESGDLIKAIECINLAIDSTNEKSQKSLIWPQTWIVKGDIFFAIYQSDNEEYASLSKDPLTVSLTDYLKALELNPKSDAKNKIRNKFALLELELQNVAIEAYNSEDYNHALMRFEQALALKDLPEFKVDIDGIDTALVYNCGLAALKAEQLDKAIENLNIAANVGYGEASTIVMVASAYQSQKDTMAAINTLEEGLVKYPGNETIMTSLIQIFMDADKKESALKCLDKLIISHPADAKYGILKADLHNQMKDTETAIKQYQAVLKLEPENQLALYNLSVIYYNKGVEHLKLTDNVSVNDKGRYEQIVKQSEEIWKKALPYMEKCHQLNAADANVLELLKNLYYRLNLMEKYQAI